jgi:hypothetical protein
MLSAKQESVVAKKTLTDDEKNAARAKLLDALRTKHPNGIFRIDVEDETNDAGEPLYRLVGMTETEILGGPPRG